MADQLNITPLLAEILWQRGYRTVEQMDRFLSPMLVNLAQPSAVPGLEDAAHVVNEALRAGKRMAVWGDYDVDGITSTAVVKQFMAERGFEVAHHLPNRLEEGYGMNVSGVEKLAESGIGLLLTVDCGITDFEPIERAKELGMTVVVTDHHLPAQNLPVADAIANPRLPGGEGGPYESLAGVGVAWVLMAALNSLLPGERVDMRKTLDLVALGTIADVVPLSGQNRILVKNGLLRIKEAARPGMAALKVVSNFDRLADLGAGQIGYHLAPRINAAGRLGSPEKGLDLLLAESYEAALPVANELDAVNAERRKQEQEITEEAMKQAHSMLDKRGFVLFSEGWHSGIIGIVASRIVEKFHRPCLLLTEDPETGLVKGSGRSIDEYDLHGGLCKLEELLEGFGGHRQAAGLSLKKENVEKLRERFDRIVADELGERPLPAKIKVDRELTFAEINHVLLKELEHMQPFGLGNPEPVFVSEPVVVQEYRCFGREREHVKLVLRDEKTGANLPAKVWRQAKALRREVQGTQLSFAFTPKIDRYNGIPNIEMNVKDWN
ncbi:single-stranded-DNA-specific exonuclease RecJ [Salidesulfovibrio brasiliensis]|uniref:single-stranded-DNA-specific exonuclease RecJ n=1 Tax=Salidesulfovibrio brasiliensis TaxID=221711 RepID=UPI0009F91D7E|nr:single-stranded-DNA-specific exonuclease RecJ [Salidesulfovibrio brasiliensis]